MKTKILAGVFFIAGSMLVSAQTSGGAGGGSGSGTAGGGTPAGAAGNTRLGTRTTVPNQQQNVGVAVATNFSFTTTNQFVQTTNQFNTNNPFADTNLAQFLPPALTNQFFLTNFFGTNFMVTNTVSFTNRIGL